MERKDMKRLIEIDVFYYVINILSHHMISG